LAASLGALCIGYEQLRWGAATIQQWAVPLNPFAMLVAMHQFVLSICMSILQVLGRSALIGCLPAKCEHQGIFSGVWCVNPDKH